MDEWLKQIDKTTAEYVSLFGRLDAAQLNRQPDEHTWSIAQNIDHVMVVNESYFPILDELKNGTHRVPFTGRFGFLANLLGKTILNAAGPDRKKKMKTFRVWNPGQGSLPGDILSRFQNHQEELKKRIIESEDLIKSRTIISSPANRFIVYRLDTAFDIIVSHEQRHLEQAKEVQKALADL